MRARNGCLLGRAALKYEHFQTRRACFSVWPRTWVGKAWVYAESALQTPASTIQNTLPFEASRRPAKVLDRWQPDAPMTCLDMKRGSTLWLHRF